jgi:hypothetical protein
MKAKAAKWFGRVRRSPTLPQDPAEISRILATTDLCHGPRI